MNEIWAHAILYFLWNSGHRIAGQAKIQQPQFYDPKGSYRERNHKDISSEESMEIQQSKKDYVKKNGQLDYMI